MRRKAYTGFLRGHVSL
jgi:hypothetical protein